MNPIIFLTLVLVSVQAKKIPVVHPTSPPISISPAPHGAAQYKSSPLNPRPAQYGSCAPASCLEILMTGNHSGSGIYTIYPRQFFRVNEFSVYCDMETDGGGWTVIQRRGPFRVQENFDKKWVDYRNGFGYLDEDFWLGLEKIFLFTVQDQVSLRVDLEDVAGRKSHGIYRNFEIGGRDKKYAINPSEFVGPAADPLWVGTPFTTKDEFSVRPECLTHFTGGWWLNDNCPTGQKMNNPNGMYNHSHTASMRWLTWDFDLKRTELKIRPSYFPSCANGGSHYYYT